MRGVTYRAFNIALECLYYRPSRRDGLLFQGAVRDGRLELRVSQIGGACGTASSPLHEGAAQSGRGWTVFLRRNQLKPLMLSVLGRRQTVDGPSARGLGLSDVCWFFGPRLAAGQAEASDSAAVRDGRLEFGNPQLVIGNWQAVPVVVWRFRGMAASIRNW